MSGNNPDRDWEAFGREDPYFGVVTQDEFRKENLDDKAKDRFFETGRDYIDWIWELIASQFGPGFRPRNGLDFGSGVGRLLIPLASRCERVFGVDVSPSMLAEARKNCTERGVTNAEFGLGLDALDAEARFDFVNSFIVFQHMRPEEGMSVLRRLLERLNPNGIGALHFQYRSEIPRKSAWAARMRRRSGILNGIANLVLKRPWSAPWMQMNDYDLNQVAWELHRAGCRGYHTVFVDHAGFHGAILIFRKPA